MRIGLMARMLAYSLLGAGSLTAVADAAGQENTPEPTPRPSLREAAEGRFLVGCAIMSSHLYDPRHAQLIAGQFSSLTPGNEMKMDALQKEKGTFTFDRAEKLADFAEKHDMKLIGHTLLWHQQAPKWLFEDEQGNPLSREEALENLENHITTVVKHFNGRVHGWDVVNEAIGDSEPYLRDTPALRAIGEDYVVKAFQFARAADPDVELYYNDYNIERDYKRDKTLRLLRELEEAGVKPDAVGIQGHWLLESPDIEEIDRGIKAYVDAGYEVMLTEVDVDVLPRDGAGADLNATQRDALDPYKEGLPADVQQKLADRYRSLFEVIEKYEDAISRVTFWGTTDENSWLNDWPARGRTNHPLLWDRHYHPKPALDAVLDVLEDSAGD